MKDGEIEKGVSGPPTRNSLFLFEILTDLNQAVPSHLADESQKRVSRIHHRTIFAFFLLPLTNN